MSTMSAHSKKMAVDLASVGDCSSCSKRFKSSFFINFEVCGHVVCKECIYDRNHRTGSENCPSCESPVSESQLNLVRSCIRDTNDYPGDACYEKTYQSSGGILVRRVGDTLYYLAALQKMKSGDLQWVSPKGRIEEGESSLDAARREIREEVGLNTLTLIDFVSKQTYAFRESDKLCKKTVFWYLFRVDQSEELDLNGEEGFVESQWITYEETFSTFSHQSFVEVVKMADRILKEVGC